MKGKNVILLEYDHVALEHVTRGGDIGTSQENINEVIRDSLLERREESHVQTAAISDNQDSEVVIQKHVQFKRKRAKGNIYDRNSSGPSNCKPKSSLK